MNNGNGHRAKCSRCGAAIKTSENIFQTAAYRETQEGDIESIGGSVLCFSCAALLLTRSVIEKEPVAPETAARKGESVHIDANDGQIMDILVNEVKGVSEVDTARLLVHCGRKGFVLDLECYDGAAWAGSRLFTWRQIAQMLIASDPDMFGRLDEPEHSVFPENLERLGFSIPKDWRAQTATQQGNHEEEKVTNNGSRQKYSFVCYKCGRIVASGENMLAISVSLETPDTDGSISVKRSAAVSSLCTSCASFLITHAMFKENPKWMDLPDGATISPAFEEVDEEE